VRATPLRTLLAIALLAGGANAQPAASFDYDFTIADAEGSVVGFFSYQPGNLPELGIPEQATLEILDATGDLAALESIDWEGGNATLFNGLGGSLFTIGRSERDSFFQFAFAAEILPDEALPIDAFQPLGSLVNLDDALVVLGSSNGAEVALVEAAPEPAAVSLATLAFGALTALATRRTA